MLSSGLIAVFPRVLISYTDIDLPFYNLKQHLIALLTQSFSQISHLQKPTLRSSPISLIMASLAVFDSLVLILDFINNWFKTQLKIALLGYKVVYIISHDVFIEMISSNWFKTQLKIP